MKNSTEPVLGVFEAWAAYSKGTGLQPIGPHRKLANRLIDELSEICPTCEGKQMIRAGERREWCSTCGGFGRIFAPGGRNELIERVLAEFPDARRGSSQAQEYDYGKKWGFLSDLVFTRTGNLVAYPQIAVDRIISKLKLKEEIERKDSEAIGRWLADPDMNAKLDGAMDVVIPFVLLQDSLDPVDLDLSLFADKISEDRLEQIANENELTKSEARIYLRAWINRVFEEHDADLYPAYALDRLEGSDGSHCYCLYLITGYSFSELDYEVIDFTLNRRQAMQRLREDVGVIYSEWAENPDVTRLLPYLE